ncbi:MAG: hypothetical protein Q8N76_04665, partial [Candidatus Omnitrophota bacterium]|nr:hypothetical protein [Candidatus Omnitrophota bacterium]
INPAQNLALLKILRPGSRERLSDLYLEVHWEKHELYVVTDIDTGAWPGGIGRIVCGLSPQLVVGYQSRYGPAKWEEKYRRHFRAASDRYRKKIYERYTAKGNDPPESYEIKLREKVYKFVGYKEVRVGDVLVFPKGTVHSLRHGIEVAEVLTPHSDCVII